MSRIKAGAYAKTDLAWCEGCTGPMPLIEILCRPSPTRPAQATEAFSAEELTIIAQNYNRLLVLTACWQAACFIPWPDTIEHAIFLVILGSWIHFGWRLSAGLRRRPLGMGHLVPDSAGQHLRSGANSLHRRKDVEEQRHSRWNLGGGSKGA